MLASGRISLAILMFVPDRHLLSQLAISEQGADPTILPVEYRNIIIGLAIPAIAGWIYKKRDFLLKKKRGEYLHVNTRTI